MKNLMIYISPTGSFNNPSNAATNDGRVLIKVQIENSLALGWRLEDILLVTNFDFQYGPVKAIAFKDIEYFEPYPKASKINAIVKLFEMNLINDNELYWFHDLDAFQLIPITESELKLGNADMGLATYDMYNLSPSLLKSKKWNTGSIFFKQDAKDIFYHIRKIMYDHENKEERALTELTNKYNFIRKRIKKLNPTYNYAVSLDYRRMVHKLNIPVRVVHYHPHGILPKWEQNPPLIPNRLVKIFSKLGV